MTSCHEKLIPSLVLTLCALQSCQSRLPVFSEAQREKNPIVGELKNSQVLPDRLAFYEKNQDLLNKRRVRILETHASLRGLPSKSTANGPEYWWENLWMADFKRAFITADLQIRSSCLGALMKPSEFGTAGCEKTLADFQSQWNNDELNSIQRKTSLRSSLYANYLKTLTDELKVFDEAYRMQFSKK